MEKCINKDIGYKLDVRTNTSLYLRAADAIEFKYVQLREWNNRFLFVFV